MSTDYSTDVQHIRQAYRAFNARDIDGVLSLMTPDVAWPNGMEGGYVHGHAAVRAYWTRQWQQVDPTVEPVAFTTDAAGRIRVEVHQLVRDITGNVLLDHTIIHRYTLRNGLIHTMEILDA